MRRFIRLMLLGTLLLVFTGWSCDYCLLVQGVSPLETAIGKGLRFDQRYTRLSTLFDNGEEINNEGISETHWTSQFSGFYSFTPQIMMLAVVPVVKRIGEAAREARTKRKSGHFRSPQLAITRPLTVVLASTSRKRDGIRRPRTRA